MSTYKKLSDTEWMCAAYGTTKVTGTSAVTGGFDGFRVDADALISEILDGNGVDVTTTLVPDTAEVLEATSIVRGAMVFSSITLTSGSVTAINAKVKI